MERCCRWKCFRKEAENKVQIDVEAENNVEDEKVEDEKVEENKEEEEEDTEEDEDNPYVIFEYNGKEYGFDSSEKIEQYYEIDEENNSLGEAVNTLKLLKPKSLNKKEVFILQDKKKKYILECLEGYNSGNIIGYKKGNDYILN